MGLAAPHASAQVIDLRTTDVGQETKNFVNDHIAQGNEHSTDFERLEFNIATKEFSGMIKVRHRHRIVSRRRIGGRTITLYDITVYDLTQSAEFSFNVITGTGHAVLNFGRIPGGNDITLDTRDLLDLGTVAGLRNR